MSGRRPKLNPWQMLELIAASDLSPIARDVLRAAVLYLDCHTLQMRPALGRLARDMGRDPRTIRSVVNQVLVPRGVLVAESSRRGGRNPGTGAGVTTTYRLDADALKRCRRPPENSGTTPGYTGESSGDGAGEPGPECAEARATVHENPGTTPAKHPVDSPSNSHPTPTGGGGGGGRISPSQEAENRSLLAGIVANQVKLDRIASKFDPDLVKAIMDYAKTNGLRGGWVVTTLLDNKSIPDEVLRAAEAARARRADQAVRMRSLRARLAAETPERLRVAATRAGVAAGDFSADALESLAAALEALKHEEAEAAERRHLDDLWTSLTSTEKETLRCRFQCYGCEEVRTLAQRSPRKRAEVLAAIEASRRGGQANGGGS